MLASAKECLGVCMRICFKKQCELILQVPDPRYFSHLEGEMMGTAQRSIQAALPQGFRCYDVRGLSFLDVVYPAEVNAEIRGKTDFLVGIEGEVSRVLDEAGSTRIGEVNGLELLAVPAQLLWLAKQRPWRWLRSLIPRPVASAIHSTVFRAMGMTLPWVCASIERMRDCLEQSHETTPVQSVVSQLHALK